MRRLVLGMLTTSVLLVSGCSGSETPASDGPTAAPTAPTSASSSEATAPPATTTPGTAAPSTDPGAGTAAATGPAVVSDLVTVHAPADWTATPALTDQGGNVSGPTVAYNLSLRDVESQASDESVDALAALSQKASLYSPPLKRRDDVVVAGQPAYELAGKDSLYGGWAEEHGFRYQGHDVIITISTPADTPQSERDSLADAILASVTLKQ